MLQTLWVQPSQIGPLNLGRNHNLFFTRDFQRERHYATRPDRRVSAFNCLFDILRMVIAAVDDNQVLKSACDE